MKKVLEKLTLYSVLLLGMDFFFTVFYGNDVKENTLGSLNTGDVHYAEAVVTFLIYLAVLFFALTRYRATFRVFRFARPLFVLNLWALLSSVWSITPDVTFRRALFFFATTLMGVYIASRYPIPKMSATTIRVFLVFLLCSVLFLGVAPEYVLDSAHQGAFRGLTSHKNTLGFYLGIFIIQIATTHFNRRSLQLACLVIGAAGLYASHSGTAIVAAAASLALLPALQMLRFTKKQLLPILVATVIVLLQVFFFLSNSIDTLLDFLGKDRTLTGRSEIWDLLLVSISRRPFTGYGFDSFWQGLRGESLNVIAGAGWLVPAAHNGYIEVVLGLGLIGLTIVTIAILLFGRESIRYARRVPGMPGLWPAAFLLYMLLHATAESSLVMRDSISWMLFSYLFVALRAEQKAAGDMLTVRTGFRRLARMKPEVEAAVA